MKADLHQATSDDEPEITVVIVDDDPYVLEGLRLMLSEPPLRVVHTCRTIDDGVESILAHLPSVAIIDLWMLGNPNAGIEVLRRLGSATQQVRCLMLTAQRLDGAVMRDAFEYKACGFYRKESMPGAELVNTVCKIARGEHVIEPALIDELLQSIGGGAVAKAEEYQETLPRLSPRQKEILALLNNGFTIKQAASALKIANSTVKTHLAEARARFGDTMNSYQLALFAAIKGLL